MTPTPLQKFNDRLDAMRLVNQIEIDTWFAAGMKRYPGQAKLKRIVQYLCDTVSQ